MNIATFNFTFRQQQDLVIPQHPGSMLRGAFGIALKTLSCVTELPQCKDCPLHTHCPYTLIFENTAAHLPHKDSGSNPYILHLPVSRDISAQQNWQFAMTLIGQAIEHYPLVIRAWQYAGKLGFGGSQHRATAELIQVSNQGHTLFEAQKATVTSSSVAEIRTIPHWGKLPYFDKITLHFTSPLRLQYQNQIIYHTEELDLRQVLIALYNRVKRCQDQHDAEQPWNLGYNDYDDFMTDILKLTLTGDMQSIKVKRHSNRQKKKIELYGLIGDITLNGENARLMRLMPLLWLGQYLHIGKNTTLGFGQYQLRIRTAIT